MSYLTGLSDRLMDIAYHTKNQYESETIQEAAEAIKKLDPIKPKGFHKQ